MSTAGRHVARGPRSPAPTGPPEDSVPSRPVARTRISAAWIGIIVSAVALVLLLVFILQNTRSVKVSYFTATGTMPLGVALLLAAVGGVMIAAAVGALRIWQLRHRLNQSRPVTQIAREDEGGDREAADLPG